MSTQTLGNELWQRLGKRLRELRDEQEISQEKLARKAGPSLGTVANAERGMFKFETWEQLIRALGEDPGRIVEEAIRAINAAATERRTGEDRRKDGQFTVLEGGQERRGSRADRRNQMSYFTPAPPDLVVPVLVPT